MIDYMKFNDEISDEMLAAYIDGNATMEESALIGDTLDRDCMLSEAFNIVCESMPFRNDANWDTFNKNIDLFKVETSDMEDILMQAAIESEHQDSMSQTNLFDGIVLDDLSGTDSSNLADTDSPNFADTDLLDY